MDRDRQTDRTGPSMGFQSLKAHPQEDTFPNKVTCLQRPGIQIYKLWGPFLFKPPHIIMSLVTNSPN